MIASPFGRDALGVGPPARKRSLEQALGEGSVCAGVVVAGLYVSGGPSLAAVLAGGPLEPVRAMDVIAQVAAGLHAAHEAGVVHLDVSRPTW